mmetsp:Transcript_24399/g.46415  ORF Transcript_24399/g.46415 Transcript_24399/m.46415 type:complete len:450 (+) Transcript_24399:87-1436(+)
MGILSCMRLDGAIHRWSYSLNDRRQDKVKECQFGLQRRGTQRGTTVVDKFDEVVFSLHTRNNWSLVHHGLDRQGGRTRVLERFTGLQNGLTTRDTRTLDNVLELTTNRLDFEATRNQLNGLVGFVGDTNIVGKAMFRQGFVRTFGAVGRGNLDTNVFGNGFGRVIERDGNFTLDHVLVTRKCRCGGRSRATAGCSRCLGSAASLDVGFGSRRSFFFVIFLFFLLLDFGRPKGLHTLIFGENKMKGTQLGRFFGPILRGGIRAGGYDGVTVISTHTSGNNGSSQGTDRKRCRAGVFKDFTGFQHGRPTRHTFTLDDILHATADGLNFKTTSEQLDGIRGGLIGDADGVLKTMFAHGRIGLFLVVLGRHLDLEWPRDGTAGSFHLGTGGQFSSRDIIIPGQTRTSTGSFGGGGFAGSVGPRFGPIRRGRVVVRVIIAQRGWQLGGTAPSFL